MPEEFDHHAAQIALTEAANADDANEIPDEVEVPEAAEVASETEVITEAPAAPAVTADPYEQYGGEDTVKNALIVANALKSEAGIRQLTTRGLQALGYDANEVEAFLARQAAAGVGTEIPASPDDPWAGRDDDDILTVAEARALQDRLDGKITAAQQAAQQPFLEQQEAARVAGVTYSVDQALIRAVGDPTAADPASTVDPGLAQVIMAVANAKAGDKVVTPAEATAYVEQAAAEVIAAASAKQAAHIADKRATKEALPTKVGGQGAGADAPAPPQNVKEADAAFFAFMGLEPPVR